MKAIYTFILSVCFALLVLPAFGQVAGPPAEAQAAETASAQQVSAPAAEQTQEAVKKAGPKPRRKWRRRKGRGGGFGWHLFSRKGKQSDEVSPEEKWADVRALVKLGRIYSLLWSIGLLLWPGLVGGLLLAPIFLVMSWFTPWKEYSAEFPALSEVVSFGRAISLIILSFTIFIFLAAFFFIEFAAPLILLLVMLGISSFVLSMLLAVRSSNLNDEMEFKSSREAEMETKE